MTYQAAASGGVRQPLNVVELLLDAAVDATGTDYLCDGDVPLGQSFLPCVQEVDFAPTKLTPGEGLGYRGTVTIKCQDFPWGARGTFFGRLLGANPYFLDRQIKIHSGFYDGSAFSWDNFKARLYIIKKIDGPNERGQVTITAADVMSLLDADSAQVPVKSGGELAGALTDSATGTINIGDNAGFDAAGGVCQIDDEVIAYSGVSGDTSIVVTARAQWGTVAAAHDAGAVVRNCWAVSDANCVDVLYQLINDYTRIDAASYITLADWEAARDDYLASDNVTRIITEPTPVADVIDELVSQCCLAVWWDDEAQKIRLKPLGPTLAVVAAINTDVHILNTGHSIKRDQSKAVTQAWVYFDPSDPVSGGDAAKDFNSLLVGVDAELEQAAGYGGPKIKKVFAKWLPAAGNVTASRMAARLVSQLRQGEVICQFRLDARDSGLQVGDAVQITTDLDQGSDGIPIARNWLVIERDQVSDTVYQYQAIASGIAINSRYARVAPNGTPNYTSASVAQRENYAFVADTATGEMSNGDDPYQIL